jgi:hypothetical protein
MFPISTYFWLETFYPVCGCFDSLETVQCVKDQTTTSFRDAGLYLASATYYLTQKLEISKGL